MSKLRLAVIGVGHLGQIHARLARQLENVELVAVVDPSPQARASVAAELNVATHGDHRTLAGFELNMLGLNFGIGPSGLKLPIVGLIGRHLPPVPAAQALPPQPTGAAAF